jgi:hypothetical protein
MWMVNPKIMCRQHLLGEHVEHHMFVGSINKETSMKGYLSDNLLEPASLFARHEALATEMESRGYDHRSPLPKVEIPFRLEDAFVKIDKSASLKELLRRCPECRARYEALKID